ncbi:MAG TPA: hypothetical protein PKV73_05575 [Agriterribacter sp.]|nr:hypothetical protein [Chitinophagaceae bacterium]HRP31336.1 hypothetical protein [Agriterribacter sp.]
MKQGVVMGYPSDSSYLGMTNSGLKLNGITSAWLSPSSCHADAACPPKEGRHPFIRLAHSKRRPLLRRGDKQW